MTSVEDTRTALPDVAGIVRRHVAERPERTALVMDDRQVTWRELGARSARVANAFVASGVGPQDRIAFCDKNSLEYFDVTFGAAMANAVVVALNWRLAPPEMEGVLNDAGAKVLIVGPDFYDHVAAIEPNLTSVALIVALGDHPRWIGFADWVGAQPTTDPHVPTRPSDVCMQLYTSGTTGLPKGVMISNAAFLALVANVSPEWDVDADSVSIVCMPLFHIGGCGWAMVCLYAGGSAVLVREFVPNEILDILIEHRITNALFVPAMLQFLPMVPGAGERDYSRSEERRVGKEC